MDHKWVLVPWPNGKFPRYICKNCKTEVIENNGKFRYFNNQFCGPTNDCDFELVKSVMKS